MRQMSPQRDSLMGPWQLEDETCVGDPRGLSRPMRQVELHSSRTVGRGLQLQRASDLFWFPFLQAPNVPWTPTLCLILSRFGGNTISATETRKTQKQKPTQILSQEGNPDAGRESRAASLRWWGLKDDEDWPRRKRRKDGPDGREQHAMAWETWVSWSVQGLGFVEKWEWRGWETGRKEAGHISCETLSGTNACFPASLYPQTSKWHVLLTSLKIARWIRYCY